MVEHEVAATLVALTEMSNSGASEREIETEIVLLLKQIGWERRQIRQDVSLSDRGTDKADIVLRLNNNFSILIEVKRHGETRNATEQVRRYARLLSPSPRLAVLTDGTRWVIYYCGSSALIPLYDTSTPNQQTGIFSLVNALSPITLAESLSDNLIDYFMSIESALNRLSADENRKQSKYFAKTIRHLLFNKREDTGTPHTQPVSQPEPDETEPVLNHPQDEATPTGTRQFAPDAPPDLRYTNVNGRLGSEPFTVWSQSVDIAVRLAVEASWLPGDIINASQGRVVSGHVTERGFRPVSGTTLSARRLSASDSWRFIYYWAQQLRLPVQAEVSWYNPEREGQKGIIEWKP
jgi:Type I restriction enzyme R protein N terminus (HSDR_N).